MSQQKLYIMMGCPGAGKSSYAQSHLIKNQQTTYVSRDTIRFGLVDFGESYFSKEREVYQEYINQINWALSRGRHVIADATHLTRKSRLQLFNRLAYDQNKVKTIIVFIDTPLDICLERNMNRAGTRAFVPHNQLEQMFHSIQRPSFAEYYKIDAITIVTPTYEHTMERDDD